MLSSLVISTCISTKGHKLCKPININLISAQKFTPISGEQNTLISGVLCGTHFGRLHPLTSLRLYRALSLPILLYGSEIWTISKSELLSMERLHRKILLATPQVRQSLPNPATHPSELCDNPGHMLDWWSWHIEVLYRISLCSQGRKSHFTNPAVTRESGTQQKRKYVYHT